MVRLLISTGEVSGDLQGSLLIRALRLEAERRGLEPVSYTHLTLPTSG